MQAAEVAIEAVEAAHAALQSSFDCLRDQLSVCLTSHEADMAGLLEEFGDAATQGRTALLACSEAATACQQFLDNASAGQNNTVTTFEQQFAANLASEQVCYSKTMLTPRWSLRGNRSLSTTRPSLRSKQRHVAMQPSVQTHTRSQPVHVKEHCIF